RVIDNGYYTKYLSLQKDNTLNFIDYFNENRHRTKRVVYDVYGKPKRTIYMDLANNRPRQNIYYDHRGRAYLSMWYNNKKKDYDRVLVLNKQNKIEKELLD